MSKIEFELIPFVCEPKPGALQALLCNEANVGFNAESGYRAPQNAWPRLT